MPTFIYSKQLKIMLFKKNNFTKTYEINMTTDGCLTLTVIYDRYLLIERTNHG